MLAMNMEIWPWCSEEHKYKIGEIIAANISALAPVSTYEVRVHQSAHDAAGFAEICEEFMLRDHDRRAGPLALIRDALLLAIPTPGNCENGFDDEP